MAASGKLGTLLVGITVTCFEVSHPSTMKKIEDLYSVARSSRKRGRVTSWG